MSNEYDVVVVGSGIAGSVLTKILTQAGKRVLLMEAGLEAGIALDPERAYDTYQNYLQTFYASTIKATNTPYPDIEDAQSPGVRSPCARGGCPTEARSMPAGRSRMTVLSRRRLHSCAWRDSR